MTLYLNHAGTSWPKPEPVRRAVAQALAADPLGWPQRFATDHRAIAGAFGTRPERVLLTPGCTSALATAIADLPWEPDDVAVTTSMEHHAVMRPLALLSRRGVVVRRVPRAARGPLDLGSWRRAVRGARLAVLSWVANTTGEILPIADAIAAAHDAGATVLVDAAQAVGWLEVDLAGLGAELVAFGGHKGTQGPWGLGGLYMSEAVELVSPREQGVGRPSWCDVGSVDRTAMAGLVAGLAWLSEHPARLADARATIAELQSALASHGFRVLGASQPQARTPVLALTHPTRPLSSMTSALQRAGIVASVGHQCAPSAHLALGTEAALRLSVGPDQTVDTDAVIRALTS